jgi:hypothetical protein
MEKMVFTQLQFVRSQTLKALEGVSEELAARIPDKFRNHILWQAGHIFLVQERFAFMMHGLDHRLPESYINLFAPGTTPLNWTITPPTLAEVQELLAGQQERLQQALAGRLEQTLAAPYTTSTGITLSTTGELINFTLYHEGMHFQAIKQYKVLCSEN